MERTPPKYFRTLAIALTARGLGFAVMEGEGALIAFGSTGAKGYKNFHSIRKIEKLIGYYQPDVLVLPDVNEKGTRRADRIKALYEQIVGLLCQRKLKFNLISGKQMRSRILGRPNGTKHDVAEELARRFPDELASQLPPKRRAWESEDGRMDIFDAVALLVAFRTKGR